MNVSDSDELFDFPCRYPVKVMGRESDDFEALVTQIVLKHAELHSDGDIRARSSASGKYLSVTIVIEAQSRQQLDLIYQDLTDNERVLMAL